MAENCNEASTREENLNGEKKLKLSEVNNSESIHSELLNLAGFELKRIINDNSQRKSICLEGAFKGKDGIAVIVLEKKPFTKENLNYIFNTDSKLDQAFFNDIYGDYECYPKAEHNGIKTSIIHPATEKHIKKFELQPIHILQETPDLYLKVTLPHLEKEQFTLQWVFNILEHKSEVERIVFEDPDPEIGFILLPDFKWNAKQVEDLYMLGVVHKKGIKSLRDLTADHLPLLHNLYQKGKNAIEEKYGLPGSQMRIYLHYQPSFYHLHVHYTNLKFDAPGIFTERAHLLTTVINNIELVPDYYQKATLACVLKETDNLFLSYEKLGVVKRAPSAATAEGATIIPVD